MDWRENRSKSMKYYKAGIDPEEMKKNRQDELFSVRKQKRHEYLKKKRNIETSVPAGLPQQYIEQMPQVLSAIMSEQKEAQIEATRKIRILLSLQNDPPFDLVISSPGLITRIISFLDAFDTPQLQLEAAWCVTNIASGTIQCTSLLVQEGTVPKLIQLLNTMYDDIKEQAIWGLGNIAGESIEFRNLVIDSGILNPLVNLLQNSTKLTMVQNASRTLSNLCRGTPLPSMDVIKELLVWLCKLVYREDEEIMINALWAFSYLTDGSEEVINEVLRTGIARRISDSLLHNRMALKIPALRAIGNIVAGNETHTQLLINVGVLPCLASLLTHSKFGICKEACWAISNITAGTPDQIDKVILANIIPPLILLVSTAQYVIKVEAAWCIANICTGGNKHQIEYVVGQGCIKPLCDLLEEEDTNVVDFILDALEGILDVGNSSESMEDNHNKFAEYIEYAEGLDKLERLCYRNGAISIKATNMIEHYFTNNNRTLENNMIVEDTHHF